MTSERSNRCWLITGCDKGLGYAIAEAALSKGDFVVATVLAKDGRSPLTEQYAGRCISRHLDVTHPGLIEAIVNDAAKEFDSIDVLVNNAGYGLVGAAEETTPVEYRSMFDVNFFGMAEVTRAILPIMRRHRKGHIINLSSLVGIVGAPGFSFYSASKFAIEGFSESLAEEVSKLGIKITIVEPGGFRSDFAGGSLARAKRIIDDYDTTSGATREYLTTRHRKQPGDPARLGQVVVDLVDTPNPPLRLALGQDALTRIQGKISRQQAELSAWIDTSRSTDLLP